MYTKYENRQFGKYEANKSEWLAQILHEITLNDGHSDEVGDVNTYGWFALIKGKLHDYIVCEDNRGFFSYYIMDRDHILWDDLVDSLSNEDTDEQH